jgi:hypothetical protein
MILRLSDFINEQDSNSPDGSEGTQAPVKSYVGKLKINWEMPDLAEEISHYDEKAKLEFYQHNITIGNSSGNNNSALGFKAGLAVTTAF